MKLNKLRLLRLRWQVNYRTRTALSLLKEKWVSFQGWAGPALSRALSSGKKLWKAYGYYAALAGLLLLLGGAAASYRNRAAARPTPSEPSPTALPTAIEDPWAALSIPVLALPEPTPEPFSLAAPVPGEVLRPFDEGGLSWSEALGQWQAHTGLDLAAKRGEAVLAAEAGEVLSAYRDNLLGGVIEIRHANGWITRYACLSTLNLVKAGQKVAKGEVISAVGDPCPGEADSPVHLHFELLVDGEPVAPSFG